jgi:hypothetical protein
MAMTRQDAISDALTRLQGIGFTMGPQFSEHGPMVAEAISTLGRNDRIAAWVEAYLAHYRHNPPPPRSEVIDAADENAWRRALGTDARATDWLDLFRRALAEHRWQEVIALWVPRLMDGYGGGLTHGLLRTAHAVRGLPPDAAPTELQRDELAHGLAYWAAAYRRMPGEPDKQGTCTLAEALRQLPRGAGAPAKMAGAVESLAPAPDSDAAISRHAATFARVLLAHRELAPVPTIQLVHTITATIATRNLLPYLQPEFGAWAYRRIWQVSASIVARVAPPLATGSETEPAIDPPALSRDEVIDRAIAHHDDHVIKLTEACLREDAIRPDPVYRALAEAITTRIPPWQ